MVRTGVKVTAVDNTVGGCIDWRRYSCLLTSHYIRQRDTAPTSQCAGDELTALEVNVNGKRARDPVNDEHDLARRPTWH